MKIDHTALPRETLVRIVREFVLSEGTDYGHRDYTLEEKIERVISQVESGKAVVTFDQDTETCSISSV